MRDTYRTALPNSGSNPGKEINSISLKKLVFNKAYR